MLPQLLRIGSFSLSGYAFFYGLGLVLACLTIYALASKEKCDRLETANYLLLTVIVSLLGAKLYGVAAVFLKSPAAALRNPAMLRQALLSGGVFYGGLAAGTVFAVLYLRRFFKNIVWKMLDITVIGVALGHAVGRVGCFLAGCCYGRPTELPWGVRFRYLGRFSHPFAGVAVHPT
jgi:phosphatidylglycerol:prolipoprotein diacylglycerol transferase